METIYQVEGQPAIRWRGQPAEACEAGEGGSRRSREAAKADTMGSVVSLKAWLGLGRGDAPEHAPLRQLVDALDEMEPDRARYLARFAYLLGRVAHADRHVSQQETAAMEALVREHGQLSGDQAMLVVSLARTSNLLFGGTADFQIAREFAETASYPQKLALARCLFAVAAADASISLAEETEIHQIVNVLRIDRPDLTALRLEHKRMLPGMRPADPAE
jgi:uncharacterized tellurite resistance protein B-like protein